MPMDTETTNAFITHPCKVVGDHLAIIRIAKKTECVCSLVEVWQFKVRTAGIDRLLGDLASVDERFEALEPSNKGVHIVHSLDCKRHF
jgi:hypothetical protein